MRSNWQVFWSLVIMAPFAFAIFAFAAAMLGTASQELRGFRQRKHRKQYDKRVRRNLRHVRISRKEKAAFGPDRALLDREGRDIWDEWDKMHR